jgi:chitodextrinase
MGPFPDNKWVICHGPDTCHYVELEAGQVLTTGQPTTEAFDTEAEAVAKAEVLNFQFPAKELADWDPALRYHPGDLVLHDGKQWKATSHNSGNTPDDVPGDWHEVTLPSA